MENKNISQVKRGEIYLYDFGTNEGSIQNGLRPALVVQCDEGNKASCTTAVSYTHLDVYKRQGMHRLRLYDGNRNYPGNRRR